MLAFTFQEWLVLIPLFATAVTSIIQAWRTHKAVNSSLDKYKEEQAALNRHLTATTNDLAFIKGRALGKTESHEA